MSIRNLSPLSDAKSVAVIGGSARPHSLGAIVLDNIVRGGFSGTIYAVNPHRFDQPGVGWCATIADLPEVPDLAVVATPAESVPGIIELLGEKGTRCAIVLSAGLNQANGLKQAMLDAARSHCLRIVGPNCLGFVAPRLKLNATFARTKASEGGLALLSQSGALVTAVLDWAQARSIGFSAVASVGDMADVDLGDLIDLYATDPATKAILLYVEGVTNTAKFMSAAAAAARIKPVIAIKAGKSAAAAKATMSHTGALAGSYDVYRAAFKRAGIVLVETLTELFDAAEILCLAAEPRGGRLGIVTNGGGAGILAVDSLQGAGATLAPLRAETLGALDAVLPSTWSHANPVDVIGDAPPDRYREAVSALLRDETVDGLIVMNCPTGQNEASAIAEAVCEVVAIARGARIDKPVLGCWLGDSNAAAVETLLLDAGIPVYTTPDDAVRAFGYLLASREARLALTDRPVETRERSFDTTEAKRIVAAARADKRETLDQMEAQALLAAYGIAVVPTRFAAAVETVEDACGWLKPPFAVKISSPDIVHKSEAGGVVLGLHDRKAAAAAACAMETHIRSVHPEVRIDGYIIEEMVVRHNAREMIAGIATDPTFGPILLVGTGGTAVEIIADKAIALPPLDHAQALALISETRMSKLLDAYRNVPAAHREAVADVLDALSAMTVDFPDIIELDINPLLVDPDGAVALDARVRITAQAPADSNLVIRPAPMEWASSLVTQSGLAFYVRPVRGDDEPLLAAFFEHVSPEDLRFRFLSTVAHVEHARLAAMTRVDYRRTITFLAFDAARENVIATAMLAADPDRTRAEVALATRADMKGRGVSWTLLEYVLRYAKAEGIGSVEAIECADHEAALRMEREMGFATVTDPDDPTVRIVRRALAPADAA
ncbi:bifunctional acetate--CoA ligase family protein/GNAT family N-acetyltransferase [Sphingomonas sp. NFR15]|uniref:bifunctional acetate--CoA ligase family protein/GNAT family N-acetyltransferase n=1 Tax=Sphingomonas sp. NFR15 TaxID=1566282 RepID=UPI00088A032C|nr:bifunctional acetate--CoA ligase family protein/GNAT family N-acetyltransferase [Sphingomonas sp. NFR15]SDA36405.1 acetyltransferase [Sphingomonas sp. NFR15]